MSLPHATPAPQKATYAFYAFALTATCRSSWPGRDMV